jgi:predicted AlkP superfamily pyrophosphatase or phosphodiesterase
MTETVSDKFIEKYPKGHVYALSLKARATVPLAGKRGKAVWFDFNTGYFTSSKAYFNTLPIWITKFNKKHKIDTLTQTSWQLFYDKQSTHYAFPHINDYTFSEQQSLITYPRKINLTHDKPFEPFAQTPAANKLLLNLSKECIENLFDNNIFLLWISLSSLDKLGHSYGPHSMEIIDMIYHLDKQIGDFIHYIQKKVNPQQILFVFTADHGVAPIPEIAKKMGKPATRILSKHLIKKINTIIEKKYGIKNIIVGNKKSYLFCNNKKLQTLNKKKQKQIKQKIKHFFRKQPGIKNAWTKEELLKTSPQKNNELYLFKNQLYPGRTGDIIIQPKPYALFSNNITGTSHMTPYDYDTHIPLMIYQKNKLEKQVQNKKVWVTQFAQTLCNILQLERPKDATPTCFEIPSTHHHKNQMNSS